MNGRALNVEADQGQVGKKQEQVWMKIVGAWPAPFVFINTGI